jgi:hypothetical protein
LAAASAEAIATADVEVRDRVRVGDRGRQRLQGAGIVDAAVRAVTVVMLLVLAKGV